MSETAQSEIALIDWDMLPPTPISDVCDGEQIEAHPFDAQAGLEERRTRSDHTDESGISNTIEAATNADIAPHMTSTILFDADAEDSASPIKRAESGLSTMPKAKLAEGKVRSGGSSANSQSGVSNRTLASSNSSRRKPAKHRETTWADGPNPWLWKPPRRALSLPEEPTQEMLQILRKTHSDPGKEYSAVSPPSFSLPVSQKENIGRQAMKHLEHSSHRQSPEMCGLRRLCSILEEGEGCETYKG